MPPSEDATSSGLAAETSSGQRAASAADLRAYVASAKIIDIERLDELLGARTTNATTAILRTDDSAIKASENGNERVEFKLELPPDQKLTLAGPRKPGYQAQFCKGHGDDVRRREE